MKLVLTGDNIGSLQLLSKFIAERLVCCESIITHRPTIARCTDNHTMLTLWDLHSSSLEIPIIFYMHIPLQWWQLLQTYQTHIGPTLHVGPNKASYNWN